MRGRRADFKARATLVLRLRTDNLLWGATLIVNQRAKKVVSDSLGLVDFDIRLMIFVLNLPDGQVLLFLGNSN